MMNVRLTDKSGKFLGHVFDVISIEELKSAFFFFDFRHKQVAGFAKDYVNHDFVAPQVPRSLSDKSENKDQL